MAKVMFLQLCVILFTGGCLPQCMLGYHNPQSRHPPHRADTPREQIPPRADTCPYWNAFLLYHIIPTCHLLCKRPRYCHITSKTHTAERISKLIPIHASLIYLTARFFRNPSSLTRYGQHGPTTRLAALDAERIPNRKGTSRCVNDDPAPGQG